MIPLVGAGTNFAFGVEAQFNDRKAEGHVAMAGLVSNLAGTAALAGGLIFGSQTVATAGVALLGVSGLTAAYAAAT